MSIADLEDLARGCRILAREGHNDLTLGHLSLRDEPRGGFWLKRAGIGLDEVRGPGDFVLLSLDGKQLGGTGPIHAEWPIHAGVLRARPDVCVVGHTHSPWATRLSASASPFMPVANYGALFGAQLRRFEDTSDLIVTGGLGAAVAERLGDNRAILLRNHGSVFCGRLVAEAVLTAVWLERAAADSLLAPAKEAGVTVPAEEELRAKRAKTFAPFVVEHFWQYLGRRLDTAEQSVTP
jgi:L-fuculose-phosphate aldolase